MHAAQIPAVAEDWDNGQIKISDHILKLATFTKSPTLLGSASLLFCLCAVTVFVSVVSCVQRQNSSVRS